MSSEGSLSWPLAHAVRHQASKIAVIDGDRTLTYRELARRVGALGTAFGGLGVPAGGFIGVLADNTLEHLECWLAIPAYGRVINDLNFRLSVAELAYMIDDSATTVLITDDVNLPTARGARQASASLQTLVYCGPGKCPPDCRSYADLIAGPVDDPPELEAATLAALSYTGGTTGRPKGVMLSHGNLLSNAKHDLVGLAPTEHDRWLHAAPMFHVADTAQTFAMTWVGATHVMLARFEPAAAAHAIEAHGVTMTLLVPTMIQSLLSHLAQRAADLSTLRMLVYGASPISETVQARAVRELPGDLVQGYGMTETSPALCFLTAEDHRRGVAGEEPFRSRLASVGRAVPGVQLAVRGLDGREVAVGEVGEVTARGPNVTLGYWNLPELTAEVLIGGWYHTGDLGRLDGDGYLTLVDRAKDMIISGGENVYSIEVERALGLHAAVIEAVVFGVPDEVWGERVHAVVVVDEQDAPDADQLVRHCRQHLAGYKTPRSFDLRTEQLPRSGAGKILKQPLREPFWRGRERLVN